RYNISLKGVATPAKVPGQFLSLFYTDRLGLYPHVDLTSRKQLNGGIPQRGDLRASLNKADLVSTLGESAAVGVSGAVLWGASADYDDQTSCAALSSYLTSTLTSPMSP
ncbi:hypothetical protein JOQ06_003572, partial [Pogonophryne albipinna]